MGTGKTKSMFQTLYSPGLYHGCLQNIVLGRPSWFWAHTEEESRICFVVWQHHTFVENSPHWRLNCRSKSINTHKQGRAESCDFDFASFSFSCNLELDSCLLSHNSLSC